MTDEPSSPAANETPPGEPLPPPVTPAPPAGARAPLWSYFLTPIAVVIGACIVAGAIWLTDDEGGGSGSPAPASADTEVDLDAVSTAPTPGSSAPTTVLGAFMGYAQQVDIDADAFRQCLGEPSHGELVNAHLQRGSELGVTGTPTFFINNKMVVGSQPAAVFAEVIEAELNGSPTSLDGYSDAIKELAATQPPRFAIVDNPPDLTGATFKGEGDAEVTIAEFSDFQCPFCQRWTLQALPVLEDYLDDGVRLAFLHFPLTSIHPNAGYASVAAICAGEQDRFWEMHDLLFSRQGEWATLPVQ